MNEIKELVHINFVDVFISIFIILFGAKAILAALEWLCVDKLGLETRGMRHRREEHELLIKTSEELTKLKDKHEESVKQSIIHDNQIKDTMTQLAEKVDILSDSLQEMKETQDEDKRSEYKDRIGQSYRYYHGRQYSDEHPVPYLNSMEKEALEGLIKGYEAHGGKNSFVHSIVEPEMQTWILIDDKKTKE